MHMRMLALSRFRADPPPALTQASLHQKDAKGERTEAESTAFGYALTETMDLW